MSDTILVVGAAGRNGAAALRALSRTGLSVRAATRNPEKIDRGAEEIKNAHVEAVRFDWQHPEGYEAALLGVERLYLIAPEGLPGMPDLAHRFVEHAVAAGVRQFVVLSAMGVEHREDLPLRRVERSVMALAQNWTILRPNWFMQNFTSGLFHPGIVGRDEIAAPAGDAAVSFIDVEDIAAVAAAVLADGADGTRTVVLTGPVALTFAEVARRLGDVAGRQIRYRPLDPDDPDLLAKMGLPGRRPEPVRALFHRVRAGLEATVSPGVAATTGRPPGTFEEFAARNADAWRPVAPGGTGAAAR